MKLNWNRVSLSLCSIITLFTFPFTTKSVNWLKPWRLSFNPLPQSFIMCSTYKLCFAQYSNSLWDCLSKSPLTFCFCELTLAYIAQISCLTSSVVSIPIILLMSDSRYRLWPPDVRIGLSLFSLIRHTYLDWLYCQGYG